MSFLDVWSFAGTNLNDGAVIRVQSIDGYGAVPPLRGADVPMASFPGRRFVQKQHDNKRVALGLQIKGSPAAIYGSLDSLAKLFAVGAQGALVHSHPDGTVRTAQAQVVAWQPLDASVIGKLYAATVDFDLADPYFYVANVVDAARDVHTSPTNFNFTHPGTVRGHRVLFDILGPAVNPQILNNTNGVSVQCLVTVAATKHLLIDSGAWTALNDGVQAIGSIRHSGAFPFMFVEPGVNALSWTATGLSASSRLTTTFQPPYI